MDFNMSAQILKPTYDLGGPKVVEVQIARAITEPEKGNEAEVLPVFVCLDKQGKRHRLQAEDVLPVGDPEGKSLHPYVVHVLNEMLP